MPTLRLTRWRALSTVLVSQSSVSADHLVGVTVEIERQDAALELGENAGQAGDQAVELLARDHLVDGVVDVRRAASPPASVSESAPAAAGVWLNETY